MPPQSKKAMRFTLKKELHAEGGLIEAHSLVNVVNPDCYLANLIEGHYQASGNSRVMKLGLITNCGIDVQPSRSLTPPRKRHPTPRCRKRGRLFNL